MQELVLRNQNVHVCLMTRRWNDLTIFDRQISQMGLDVTVAHAAGG